MQSKKFQRTIEDFVCDHCGRAVQGSGYTNHCPNCLWSKHVDVNPGDRAESCDGLMEPIRVEGTAAGYTLVHRCQKCGIMRKNKVLPGDDTDTLIVLAKSASV